jgi:hypothetical protein
MAKLKEPLFDGFELLVDWREGVARETAAVLRPLGHGIDCHALALAPATHR